MAVSGVSDLAGHDRPAAVIDRGKLDELLTALAARGFKVIGPTVRDQAIVMMILLRPPS